MKNLTASQIVGKLLEYGADPDMPKPGQPGDPWRQTTAPIEMSAADFLGKRPGEQVPGEDADHGDEVPPAKPVVHPRFSWRPPNPPQ